MQCFGGPKPYGDFEKAGQNFTFLVPVRWAAFRARFWFVFLSGLSFQPACAQSRRRDFFDLFLMSKYFNTEFYLLTFQVQDCFQFDANERPSSQDAGSPGNFAVIVLTCWHRQG